jgi:hypothetical protein
MRVVQLRRSFGPLLIAILSSTAPPLVEVAVAQADTRQLLAAEARDIEAAGARWGDFDDLAQRLDKTSSVSRSDFEALQRRAQTAKTALAVLQRQLPSVVTKLKSAGRWTQALDEALVRKLQKTGQSDLVQAVLAAGGARRMLEQAPAEISLASAEMDSTVRRLEPKVAWQRLLEPFLGQPVHAASRLKMIIRMVKEFLDCVIGPCD